MHSIAEAHKRKPGLARHHRVKRGRKALQEAAEAFLRAARATFDVLASEGVAVRPGDTEPTADGSMLTCAGGTAL